MVVNPDDVIAPKKWFGPQNEKKSTRDLILKGGHCLILNDMEK